MRCASRQGCTSHCKQWDQHCWSVCGVDRVTKTAWCAEHNALTTHEHLQAIGWVCMPCLHIYFTIHERFVDFGRIHAEKWAEMHAPLGAPIDS